MGIEDEVQSPRIYYKKDGATYDIALYSDTTTDDAVGYLRYGVQLNWQTDDVEEYYLPYVAIGHTKASHIHIMIGGVEYALLRQGYIVGTHSTIYDTNPPNSMTTIVARDMNGLITNEDSSNSYNMRISGSGRMAWIIVMDATGEIANLSVGNILGAEGTIDITLRCNGRTSVQQGPHLAFYGWSNLKVEVWQ